MWVGKETKWVTIKMLLMCENDLSFKVILSFWSFSDILFKLKATFSIEPHALILFRFGFELKSFLFRLKHQLLAENCPRPKYIQYGQKFIGQWSSDLLSKQKFKGLDLLWSWIKFHVMGRILKVLVWSLNQQYFVMLSLSVAEISVEEEALVAQFLFNITRLSVPKIIEKLERNWEHLPHCKWSTCQTSRSRSVDQVVKLRKVIKRWRKLEND